MWLLVVGVLTVQMSAPLLHGEQPPPVLFPGLNLLVMRGSHGVKLPFPVLQLSHQQLELSSLPLDGGATRVVRMQLSQKDTRVTHARATHGWWRVGCDRCPDLTSPQRAACWRHPGPQLGRGVKTCSSFSPPLVCPLTRNHFP